MRHHYMCYPENPDNTDTEATEVEAQSPGDAAEEFARQEGEDDEDDQTRTVYVRDPQQALWTFRVTARIARTYIARRIS